MGEGIRRRVHQAADARTDGEARREDTGGHGQRDHDDEEGEAEGDIECEGEGD